MSVWRSTKCTNLMGLVTITLLYSCFFHLTLTSATLMVDEGNLDVYNQPSVEEIRPSSANFQRRLYLNTLKNLLERKASDVQNLIESMRAQQQQGFSLPKRGFSVCLPGSDCEFNRKSQEMENAENMKAGGNNPGRRRRRRRAVQLV